MNKLTTAVFELTEDFPFNLFSIEASGGTKPIYIGSPFSGYPRAIKGCVSYTQHSLLIDSNIMIDIIEGRNTNSIRMLLTLLHTHKMKFSIIFAASEIYLTYHNPDEAIESFALALKNDHGVAFPIGDIDKIADIVKVNLEDIRKQITVMKDYLIIVKNIFLMDGGVKKHTKALTEIIKYNNLPQFGFAMLLSLVLFYARKNQAEFDTKMISKIDTDMQIKKSRKEEEKLLNNVARDICLYLACADAFYHFSDQVNEVSWLASGDATVGLMLSEIHFTKFNYQEKKSDKNATVCLAEVDLRKDAKSYKTLKPIISKYWGENLNYLSLDNKDINEKRINLRSFAESIMNNYQWEA